MEPRDHIRRQLVEYLLGKLPEKMQEELAGRYFADDSLFDQLLQVENDLLDQYVRGRLSPEERKDFEAYLSKLPDGRHRVAVAGTLVKVILEEREGAEASLNKEASVMAPDAAVSSKPEAGLWWRSLLALARRSQLALKSLLVALLILLVFSITWLAVYNQLHEENKQLRAEIANREAEQEGLGRKVEELEHQFNQQRVRTEQLRADLEREQQRSDALAQEVARFQGLHRTNALLVLDILAARSPSTPQTLVLKRNTRFVSITIPIKGNGEYVGYRVVLQTTEGERVSQSEKQHSGSKLDKAISLRLPVEKLNQNSYKLSLVLIAKDGLEIATDYYFNVVKQ